MHASRFTATQSFTIPQDTLTTPMDPPTQRKAKIGNKVNRSPVQKAEELESHKRVKKGKNYIRLCVKSSNRHLNFSERIS